MHFTRFDDFGHSSEFARPWQNHLVGFYPDKIESLIDSLTATDGVGGCGATGTAVNFKCGSFVRFGLSVDEPANVISDLRFATNGCGFAAAAAELVCRGLNGKELADLHGLDESESKWLIASIADEIPAERLHCVEVCFEALRATLAEFRKHRIAEFDGGEPLLCTCFGVSERVVEQLIGEKGLHSVEEVTHACNAGGGCGSCRMLIQEMIDQPAGGE